LRGAVREAVSVGREWQVSVGNARTVGLHRRPTGWGGRVPNAPRAKRDNACTRHNRSAANSRLRVHSTPSSTATVPTPTPAAHAVSQRRPRDAAAPFPSVGRRHRAARRVEAACGAPARSAGRKNQGESPSTKEWPAWPHTAPAPPPRQRVAGHCAVDGGRGGNGAGQRSGANGPQIVGKQIRHTVREDSNNKEKKKKEKKQPSVTRCRRVRPWRAERARCG